MGGIRTETTSMYAEFFISSAGHGDNFFFTNLYLARTFFNVYCLLRTFSLVLVSPKLRIEAPPPSTVQYIYIYIYIYTFLKRKTSRLNFRSYVLILVKIKVRFFFFQTLLVLRTICQSAVPSIYYQFSQFIGQACQNSQIERANLSTMCVNWARFWANLSAAKWLRLRWYMISRWST